jgi:hypothetical protein
MQFGLSPTGTPHILSETLFGLPDMQASHKSLLTVEIALNKHQSVDVAAFKYKPFQ